MWKNNHHGYSLIELCIVLLLITLVTTFGVTSVTFLNNFNVNAALHTIRATCKQLQQRAQSTQKTHTLIIDQKNNCLRYNHSKIHLNKIIQINTLDQVFGPPGSPQKTPCSPVTFKKNIITFYKNGSISSGTIYLTDQNNQHQYALSNSIGSVPTLQLYRWKNCVWQTIN